MQPVPPQYVSAQPSSYQHRHHKAEATSCLEHYSSLSVKKSSIDIVAALFRLLAMTV